MGSEQRTNIQDRFRQITESPEHQRKRRFAQKRAQKILSIGLPVALVVFMGLAALSIPPLYVAISSVVIAVASGWAIGTQVAANKKRNLPFP